MRRAAKRRPRAILERRRRRECKDAPIEIGCCRFRHILSTEVGQARLRCAVPTSKTEVGTRNPSSGPPKAGPVDFAHPTDGFLEIDSLKQAI